MLHGACQPVPLQAAVYLDAVFHPLFPEEEVLFQQEGWRYELANASDPSSLKLAGVVYSEMTGVYANPQTWLLDNVYSGLFPNTTYAHSSGGLPWVSTANCHLPSAHAQQAVRSPVC